MARFLCGFFCLAGGLLSAQPNFIVGSVGASAERSRNEVKEDFGNSLHALVDTAARVQMAAGKAMMMLAAMQRAAAGQAAALVEDAEPFSSAATGKIAQLQGDLEKETIVFEKILDQLEGVVLRAGAAMRLEEKALPTGQ